MSAHESYSTLVNSRAPRLAPGATTQSFQTFASAAFDEPIDANDPTVIQRMSVFLQIYLLFAVTACAFMGAAFLLFCRS